MSKTAIYCRVSTEIQDLSPQIGRLEQYCRQRDVEFEVFAEKISGGKDARPILDAMMQRVRAGEFNAVAVTKLDRLGRSLQHLIKLMQEFRNAKVRFVCLEPEIDTETAQGRFFFQIMGAVSEFERELIRSRVQDKMDQLKAQGVKLGRPAGAKDKKVRKKGGYWLRYSTKKPHQ